jgi:hypothetical protein
MTGGNGQPFVLAALRPGWREKKPKDHQNIVLHLNDWKKGGLSIFGTNKQTNSDSIDD